MKNRILARFVRRGRVHSSRGRDVFMPQLFTVKRLEDVVQADHPLRPIRLMVNNEALVLSDGLFAGICSSSAKGGRRRSVAPEKWLRAMLLRGLHGRGEPFARRAWPAAPAGRGIQRAAGVLAPRPSRARSSTTCLMRMRFQV
ncbi:hypothetical protein KFS84_06495 [Xanthomonas translucens pv. graminis]|nr:hypothetical protein KFS84_06495 [Xanthomonas translucens pv. graminis]WIH09787.1 hypothetical protein KM579_07115 [Xanthomonas translucens pv. graminis]WIH11480.1 hypothetical protein KM563_14895 [Xanthomonas translucens pv. graminis]WIH15127.1 hypothetical protein KM433_14605 [Xanthomonas translucens pv. graminis]